MNLDLSILKHLERFPRVVAFEGVTPFERLNNLSAKYPNCSLFSKRDDCNGLAFGGNKVRQVEYYFGDALQAGADTVLITGAVQSNFVRITAAMAAKLGMQCHVQLESRVNNPTQNYHSSGNVLVNRLLGATIHYYPFGEDEAGADKQLYKLAKNIRKSGGKPYVIPLSLGHKPLGALGYIRAAVELVQQAQERNIQIDEIYLASGSGSTHAGLLYGLRALGSDIKVTGICVRRNKKLQFNRILARCRELNDLLNIDSCVTKEDVVVDDDYLEPGYGKASPAVWESIAEAAQSESLILDPTYTGKVMASFLNRAKIETRNVNLLLLHTGGTPALFAHQEEYEHYLSLIV